ncbi:MAG TPA: ring-cleaving dioxygenase [Candidatus Dormibacteraeota bacterium]|jgi:glyoxalase family protein|nr:ring-cleaving dioxygenase [Candidatus Dormibacteraeota bacterium]
MDDPGAILGLHHVTAICGHPQPNVDFYTGVLGLRLIKLTVNFDDPGAYHLYYGDAAGRPGSVLTFFAWPGAQRGHPGAGQVTAVAFAVPDGSLGAWRDHLGARGVAFEPDERFGRPLLRLQDPDGLVLELADGGLEPAAGGDAGLPAGAAIERLSGVTATESNPASTGFLTSALRFDAAQAQPPLARFAAGDPVPGSLIDVIAAPGAGPGRVAVGTVHHVAWRVADDATQLAWKARLEGLGAHVSPVMDRVYFHSIYFREPGGVLFEIATDGPGFTVDEPLDRLGHELRLPPWMAPDRGALAALLPPLRLPSA